jgi:DnaD/phage-associated family protein
VEPYFEETMSAFQSPNYTQTPNDLFDELLPEMGLAELKVVMCIVRHTFGYHRDEVKLSIRAIARFTGLTANSVMEGARQAEDHGLIERYQDGNKTTLWRAAVSVVATETPASRLPRRRVSPTDTQLGIKERIKKIKDIEEEEGDPKTQNLFMVYTQEIGLLTPLIADALEDWEKLLPEKWICDAIAEAAKSNARSWKYIEAILKRWKAQGNQESARKQSNGSKPVRGETDGERIDRILGVTR